MISLNETEIYLDLPNNIMWNYDLFYFQNFFVF